MNFEDYCNKYRDKIYNRLLEYIPNKFPKEHYHMVMEYTKRRGKYFRPNLAILWCELYGGNIKEIFLPACAIQMAEDWLLIHDDWEDGNSMRRGRPSAHKLFGDVFAINAGDTAHMIMWKIVHDSVRQLPSKLGEMVYQKFYNIMLVTAEGQYYDLKLSAEKDITKFTLEAYWKSIHAKAGYYSVYGPMQLGAIVARKPSVIINGIKKFGTLIGNAFQLKDDILDCDSDPKKLGKSLGTDIYQGTKTAILWHFVQNANKDDLIKVQRIYLKDRKNKSEADVKLVIKLFHKCGSINYAKELVSQLATEALEIFERQVKQSDSPLKEVARDAIIKMAARDM